MPKLDSVKRSFNQAPPRIVMYGVGGLGKSTFAASAPNPIFIPVEDGISTLDVDAFPVVRTYADIMEDLSSLCTEEHDYKTVVIDSLDWLEPIIQAEICAKYKADSMATACGGYGKAYVKEVEMFHEITKALDWLRINKGMTPILLAHCEVRTFNDPYSASYDRYFMKIHKLSCDFMYEWSDIVLFAYMDVAVVRDGNTISVRPIGKDGGNRKMRAVSSPAAIAKNRHGLPEVMDLRWDEISSRIKFYDNGTESKEQ